MGRCTGAMAGSVSAAKGYSGSCPDGGINIGITGLVQDWADGTATNDGVRVMAASESDSYGWKSSTRRTPPRTSSCG